MPRTPRAQQPGQAVEVVQPSLPALASDPRAMLAVITENLGGDKITERDLDRIKMPSGGGLAWEVPGLGDQPDSEKTIEGVIVYHKTTRAYWPGDYEGGNEPPQCS